MATLLVVLAMFAFELFWAYGTRPKAVRAIGAHSMYRRWFHPVTYEKRKAEANAQT
ncbi:MAG: hypothetical protein H0T66_16450 [Geodermatophilaceae bacterium]|nr:hypothetical protein [Geodermatophilaceae bacterium]MDQ3455908.1 hypothetical protein [Actinomycetota bacterium]